MKKRKLKKKAKKILLISISSIIIIIIVTIIGINKYKQYLYEQTYEYKLLQKDYSLDEANIIQEKLNDEQINNILEKDKIPNLTNFIQEKYFMYKNLDRYLSYYQKHIKEETKKIISLVNTNRDYDYYENTKPTDTSKDILMLVNKYNYLNEDYEPNNLVKVSSTYAYEGNILRSDILEIFKEMVDDAKKEGIKLILNSSYRTYKDQEKTWTSRKNTHGIEKADSYAARAGYSEHQTGLALDINEFQSTEDDFENTESFKWLEKHAHEYGFILRYPKNAEDITGYSYESWHYRYVGKDIAKIIKEENIIFDEYYAFYLDN